ncbi:MAG: peptide chain release factor 2 [Christensenellales bacterium]|nr:peptide chain release factor 2 [Clostridiales bacterium]MEE1439233.1 peptide chain release factor 2 [Christensenellales bacterium]HIR80523.1 peptide chain release factor 2 [Candidatus Limiplasma merdipullorum]
MIDQERMKQDLARLRDTVAKAADALKLPHLREELAELKEEMNAPEFWNNLERSTAVNRKVSHIESKLDHVKRLETRADDVEAMLELLSEDEDEGIAAECEQELESLSKDADALELETLMRGDYDSCNAVLSLHAGAGGTEAQDWTQMLYRMYTRYCERHGFKVTVNDLLDGDEAGIKSVTFQVDGENAYGFLRSEKGVHRLVRISPFDANARRHTSFSSLDVSPILEDDQDFEINMEDVRIDTYRAGGAGGQHVNRTDSAVRMTHIPTGIVAQCQNERSQVQNREVCLRILKSRLLELREREKEEQMADIKGEMKKIEWGSQIRSYVFQPYTMVKDHRTGYESGNVDDVMDGNLDGFITAYLKMQ